MSLLRSLKGVRTEASKRFLSSARPSSVIESTASGAKTWDWPVPSSAVMKPS